MAVRVIPCLLLKNKGLVKTVKFRSPSYVGDPINAVKIFNDKEVDELIFLDIEKSVRPSEIDYSLIEDIASECFMPFCYGGGISSVEQMKTIYSLGAEKVCINTQSILNPQLIREAAEVFGSQSVIVSMDIKKGRFSNDYKLYAKCGTKKTKIEPWAHAIRMQELGAGEIFINSIDLDGTRAGYDLKLIQKISSAVDIPVIASGGAGSIVDMKKAVDVGGASAVAAGSLFVFHGMRKGVLINYPSRKELESQLGDNNE